MAQTTPDASFGPVLFMSVLPVVYLVDYYCRCGDSDQLQSSQLWS